MIPYARPDLGADDIQAVLQVLRTEWLTQGPLQAQFEDAIARYCGVQYAVAVSSGTAALHLAYLALGLGPGQKAWTSPITFVATANAALHCGAAVGFVDIDPRTYNLSPAALKRELEAHPNDGPAIVIPVHFGGQSCDMEEISRLTRPRGIAVVEDASHAMGGTYQERPIGCCQWSDAAILSFHAVKIITTGEGGMILTNRADLYESLIRLRTHGITRQDDLFQQPSHGPWYYEQIDLGFNYRLTDIQAALGLSQVSQLTKFLARRCEIAAAYDEAFAELPLIRPWRDPKVSSSWHLYVIQLVLDRIKKSHRQTFEELREAGIGVNLHYIPVHLQPFYRNLGFKPGDFPQAEKYYRGAITLPIFSRMTQDELNFVIAQVRKVLLR
ncbi:MAG: UDP-4-amino-4,6-dideoxy-N-acetyl-beta-L-altrosamine transaminase [Verrucomicrobia bacterium]|nr:UDP-4-amino-4,6-dideoxy-N-acetyl-beta-L-altrosamine transaminase [Verrucomicrobiota bacterium]